MSGCVAMLLALGRKAAGILGGTISTTGTSGNASGFSTPLGIGSLSAVALSSGLTIREMYDNTSTNRFVLSINDPGSILTQDAFTQIDVNGRVFDPNAAASFTPAAGVAASWQWGNAGVAVTAAGRPFAIT